MFEQVKKWDRFGTFACNKKKNSQNILEKIIVDWVEK